MTSDVEALIDALASVPDWDPDAPAVVTRAPGRLDVMGGIADYSGSLVLELPLRVATSVALQRQSAAKLTVASLGRPVRRFEATIEELRALDYDAARSYFRRDPDDAWAAYATGAFLVAMRETNARFDTGARMVIYSDVPEGKGVASSAALTVASMTAVSELFALGLEPREMAFMAQKVENAVAGAPCGIMDPMTSLFGEADRLLALLCRPAEIQGTLAIPEDLAFWGIDSGVTHAVSGSDYTSVRVGAFMGRRILGVTGHLAELSPQELESRSRELPETISGAEFLDRYGETGDPVTTVDPDATYRVQAPTAHPIHEHHRVTTFARLLERGLDEAPRLGALMVASHASYSACGLGSEGTDALVALAREAGPERGIYGAKITGGGSGGTVAILARRDAEAVVREIAERYGSDVVLEGSSAGARAFGCRRL